MSDKETQAHDLVRRKEWANALQIFDELLSPSANNFKFPNVRVISCLVGRTECYMELKNYEGVITDCRRLLKMLNVIGEEVSSTTTRIRRKLIHALYKLKRFEEAENVCSEWLYTKWGSSLSKVLERYRTVIQIANGQKSNQRISIQRLDEEMSILDNKLENWATHNLHQDYFSRFAKPYLNNQNGAKRNNNNNANNNSSSSNADLKTKDRIAENNFQKQIDHQMAKVSLNNSNASSSSSSYNNDNENGTSNNSKKLTNLSLSSSSSSSSTEAVSCTYCAINFSGRSDLRAHCQTEAHQNVIMSDEGETVF